MDEITKVTISVSGGELSVSMLPDGDRYYANVDVNGRPHHFERLTKEDLLSNYKVDNDPDYQPVTDEEGYCYVLVPYSR